MRVRSSFLGKSHGASCHVAAHRETLHGQLVSKKKTKKKKNVELIMANNSDRIRQH